MVTRGPKYPQVKKIFQPTPLDVFFQKRISKLPKDIPDTIKKEVKAYPNFEYFMYIQPSRDVKKWILTARDLYYRIHKGEDSTSALKVITSGWDKMEKLDFERWLHFYQEGAQKKYKTAQINYWEDANRAGYFVPIFPDRPKEMQPVNMQQDIDNVKDKSSHPDINSDEKREIIEKQRSKIIGRLDSAEKLIRSHEGQIFAGSDFEALLEIIYQLKKKIHMVNKISVSTRLYEDMIVREANILTKNGFTKAASFLNAIAQAIPNPAEAPNPIQMGGMPGNWINGEGPGLTPEGVGPNDTAAPTDPTAEAGPYPAPPGIAVGKNPGQPGDVVSSPPAPANPNNFPGDPNSLPGEKVDEPVPEGLQEFLNGLSTNNDTFDDVDGLEVHDTEDFITTAQEAPQMPAPPAAENGIEVNENQIDPNAKPSKDFESMLDTAFSGLTVGDIVNKLEEVAKVFKVREVPRQLAFVDLMLNRLDLASLFPSLAEAINKSLESNQYISTRVDDILSRLRGTLDTKNIDLTGNEQEQNPQTQQVKQKLIQENDQEQSRKKMRKDQENQELTNSNKISPEVDVAGEMAEPMAPAPATARPPLPTR
jgi:hypothetical protein